MSILNLPRQKGFLQELIGVIPGRKEPQLHINTFFKPLVDELQILWQGLSMKRSGGIRF